MADGSLAVRDAQLSRASIFDSNGDYVSSIPLERPALLIAGGAGLWPTDDSLLVSQGSGLDSLEIRVFERTGTVVGAQKLMGVTSGQGVRIIQDGQWLFSLDNRFDPRPLFAVAPGGVVAFGSGLDYSFEMRSVDGERLRVFGRQRDRSLVTEADKERVMESLEEQIRIAAPAGEIEPFEFPTHRPGYTHLLADAEGNWWAGARSGPEFDRQPSEYDVYDRLGRLLGTVSVPAMRITQIDSDLLVGVESDSLGIQSAVVYALVKSN
jgi:hypothetical protein